MRLGIFGGTFDPVHTGHLIAAEHVRTELDLARVLFVPAGQPWFKTGRPVTGICHRFEMTRLAIEDNSRFDLSDIEVRRDGPTYTVDTLAALREELGAGAEFYLILGIDALNELHRWRRPRDVLDMATVVGVTRGSAPALDRAALMSIRRRAADEMVIVEGPAIDISAEGIRRRMAGGLSVRYLVPRAVEEYAKRHDLYRREERA